MYIISIGNGMTCSGWYLAIIPRAIFQNCPKYHKQQSGEWYLENFEILRAGIIAKYYIQVMLLFVYNRSQEIFGNTYMRYLSFHG